MSQQSSSNSERANARRCSGCLTVLAAFLLIFVAPGAFAETQSACTVTYTITPQGATTFGASIAINNVGTNALSSWTLTWNFANGQTISSFWNGVESQSGTKVTVSSESYNGSIAASGSLTSLGFNGTWNGATNATPTFSLNGLVCDGKAPTPTFTLAPSAASLSVAEAGSATDTITVNPIYGFTSSVTLAASGLPTGVTAAFGTNPTTGSSVITFTAAASATTGSSTVTITGTSGSLKQTATIALTVKTASCSTSAATSAVTGTVGAGAWHTSGSKILDANGNQVRMTGINWYGFETPDEIAHGLWVKDYKDLLTNIKALGYNVIRIPFSNEMVETNPIPINFSTSDSTGAPMNAALKGQTALTDLDTIVAYAGSIGLRVILDNHRSEAGETNESSGLWYTTAYPQSAWIADWQTMATRYSASKFTFNGNPTVIGMDLRNEPHLQGTGSTTGSCWTGDTATNGCPTTLTTQNWPVAAEAAGNAILAINPNLLIFVEGNDSYSGVSGWEGGNLIGVAKYPVKLSVANQLVYSAHDYGPNLFQQTWFNSSTTQSSLFDTWNKYWGYISADGIAPVWVGEFGTENVATDVEDTTAGSEGQWFQSMIAYLAANTDINWTYWALNGEDTYGLLDNSYDSTPDLALKQTLLASIQSNGSTPAEPGFTLTASPASVSVAAGKTATSTIAVVANNCFDSSVTFTIAGLPSGVTATFSPTSSTTSSVLTLTASSSAAATTTPATITITGTSGSLKETVTIALTVTTGTKTKATLTTPTPSSTLSGSTATFAWTTGSGVTAYKLTLGTKAGGSDIYNSYTVSATSATVKNIPTNGATIYATLYSQIGGVWSSNAYTYTEASTSGKAVLTSPTPGSVLIGSSATFTWTKGTNVTAYKLILGTTVGGSDIYNSYTITGTSVTVKNIPTTGATIHATLYSEIGGIWSSNNYTFTEYAGK